MSGMSVFMIVLFACSVAGLLILVISAVSMLKRAVTAPSAQTGTGGALPAADAAEQELGRAADKITEELERAADKITEELDRQARAIFEELNGKYQELLFLFSMVDKSLGQTGCGSPVLEPRGTNPAEKSEDGGRGSKTFKNPNLARIEELADGGSSVADIAKALNMGQGEVRMIMNLGKL